MKKCVVLGIALTIVALIFGCSAQTTKQTVKNQKQMVAYDANGITFSYPKDWEVISPSQLNIQVTDYTYLAVLSNKTNGNDAIVRMVIVQPNNLYKSYQDYIEYLKKNGSNIVNTKVNGISALEYSSTGKSLSGNTRKSVSNCFEKNGEIYDMTLSSTEKDFKINQADFKAMMDTFQIK